MATPSREAPRAVGRFELRRPLGEGAQATVWLGYDPRLEREVAVKLMRTGAGTDPADITHWLHEARSVSRVTHPNVVPVYEADVHEGRPYLVFEYVPGRTLGERLRAGRLPPREAVQLMVDVLDALQAAHAAGIVHRDLKPSNILVEPSGRPRVMDFGIAARVKDAAGQQPVVGTPGYMSPEAAHGAAPTPSMDVFSAGLVLAEAIHGRRLVAEKDPYRAIYRAAHEDVTLPADFPREADDRLRAIVLRALARDVAERHADARAFREALQDWLSPLGAPVAAEAGAGPAGAGASATLDFLLRRMRHRSDFPALSQSITRIHRVANSENESLGSLSNEILKDVALTNKLLRMVNSANYRHAGGGSISTVSRAVALVGFAGIRNMALSLVLLEHMQDKSHASQLKEEFVRSLMAGSIASELVPAPRESEEAFIGSMFQNLGRLLTQFYFPEEAQQIRGALADHAKGGRPVTPSVEATASAHVLGISYEELGVGVARTWGLPEALQRTMRRPVEPAPPRMPDHAGERLRWLTFAANEVADAMLRAEPGDTGKALGQAAERYARVLGIAPETIAAAATAARGRLAQLAEAMNLHVAPGTPAARLLRPDEATNAAADPEPDTLTALELHATAPMELPARAADNAAEVMAAGIQDITNSMVESFRLNEVLRMILETMYRALDFRRVVFCLRDPRTETLVGRFGLGEDAEGVAGHFRIALRGAPDLFTAVCLKGADTLISDSGAPPIAARLPAWYRDGLRAPTFLLLPLLLRNAPFALIYADKARAGGLELGERELSLLRTLRNQAVMAFRQVG